ncbi:NUDIX hydrolase [Parafilimonas sp.]|uniref:NUDIX hydrolase n=1 Tax=Parafilimonas sp. TaxID=1969739 RepID=UPI0039E5275C
MTKKITAAGGLVFNDKDELLMIFRRGKWDLPKGKLDEGETIEQCAVREVQEETGLQNVQLESFLGITHHSYFEPRIHSDVFKETHWYKMHAAGVQKLVPQTEEDIEQIEWVDKKDFFQKLQNSYTNIVDIIGKL